MGDGGLLLRGRLVKVSILASFAAVVGFVVLAFLVTVYLLEHHTRDADLERTTHAVETLWRQKLESDAGLMQAVVTALFGNALLADALAASDRDRLWDLASPLFNDLRKHQGITHLYFTDAKLLNVLRLHQPGAYGDTINRLTTLRARQLAEAVHGIELGPLGTLTLRTVVPWVRDGRQLGYVELGEEIEHVLQDIRAILGVDLLAFVDKRFLSREQWEFGRKLMHHAGDWADFDSLVLVGQATERPPTSLGPYLERLPLGGGLEIHDHDEVLYLATLPLTDAGGTTIGRLLIVRDATLLETAFRRSMVVASLVSAAAGLVVFLFFRSSLGRVERDYGRQHQLERQLLSISEKHQRLVQIEKLSALGTMTGEIAHQLNNPLVGVVNMAQLAERQIGDPERIRGLLQRIQAAGNDCHAFVQRMLEFSKVSSSERRPADLRQIIHEAVSVFRQSAGRRVTVSLDLPAAPVALTVDTILLRHAVFNLLTNAAQAVGDRGGTVWVALHPCCRTNGDTGWRLSVADNGPGFPPDVAERLFAPFFTTRRDGTGLGLPVVLHVALVHDGAVTADNRPEGGAEFAIWLPQDKPASEQGEAR